MKAWLRRLEVALASGSLLALLAQGCSARTSLDVDDDDGAGGGTSTCTAHEDCGTDHVCVFTTGECVPSCPTPDLPDVCPTNLFCDACGTSSCPNCRDCVGACLPEPPAPG